MKAKERKQLLSALEKELSILNDTITGKFAREKISLQETWTESGFEGPKDHILFLKYQELVKNEYAAKLQKQTIDLNDGNFKLGSEDFDGIRDTYLGSFRAIYRVMESEFTEVPEQTKLSLENFDREMTEYIASFLAIENNYQSIRKASPAVKTAKRAVRFAWLAILISVIPYLVKLVQLVISSLR
jgi:hypothetical protein